MKSQVPRGVPWIFPLVRHGNDVGVVEMLPLGVATVLPFVWRRELAGVAVDPLADVVVKKLFRPNHAGERLALDVARVGIDVVRLQSRVKLISLAQTRGKVGVEITERFRPPEFSNSPPPPSSFTL